ncbi:Glutamate synthase [NADPH] large chain [subsurface metagenome]
MNNFNNLMQSKSLYDPSFEHDSCGVGFIARIDGNPSHSIIEDSIKILHNLEHRGAVGSDQATGDGSGLLIRIPDLFFRRECLDMGLKLPDAGDYCVAMIFLPGDKKSSEYCTKVFENIVMEEKCEIIGWRDVPVNPAGIGELARSTQPQIRQLFLSRGLWDHDVFERKLYVIRRIVENELNADEQSVLNQFYVTSMSSRTINYKGFMNGEDLPNFFPDLHDKDFKSPFAIVHQRYSTNTFPSWNLAEPLEHGPVVNEFGLNTDVKGNLIVDSNMMTSVPGVFAAGDSVMGASLVVKAIKQGRKAAEAADRYLATI